MKSINTYMVETRGWHRHRIQAQRYELVGADEDDVVDVGDLGRVERDAESYRRETSGRAVFYIGKRNVATVENVRSVINEEIFGPGYREDRTRCPICRSYVVGSHTVVDGKWGPPYAIGCSNEDCFFWATEESVSDLKDEWEERNVA